MKEILSVLNAIAPFLIVFSIYVFLRKLWYYLLRDVIKEKINEIQSINKKVLKCIGNELSDHEPTLNPVGNVRDDYFDEVKELFNEISTVAHYGAPGLSTSAFLPSAMLNRMTSSDFKSIKGTQSIASPPFENDFKRFVYNSLLFIESNSIRPVSLPDGIKVYTPKWINFKFKGFFSGGEIKYINGLEQGPFLNPLGRPAAEFFFRVLKHHASIRDCYLQKRYFQVMGGNNAVFLPFFMERKVSFPLKICIERGDFFGDCYAHLVSVGFSESNSRYELTYCSLNESWFVTGAYDVDNLKDKISKCFDVPFYNLSTYEESEIFSLNVSESDAGKDFYKKSYGMTKEMARVLNKNFYLLFFKWSASYFIRVLGRILASCANYLVSKARWKKILITTCYLFIFLNFIIISIALAMNW